MDIYYGDDGIDYVMADKIGSGGVGTIYNIQNYCNHVAKIFFKREKQRDRKIEALKHLTWSDEIKKYITLPKVILYENKERTRQCGFVMEKVDCSTLLTDTFIGDRPLSIRRRAIVGLNICRVLKAVHENGGRGKGQLLMGDFNFNNIAVNRYTGEIHILDTDSFHLTVRHNGKCTILPCTELHPDFFMPEIVDLMNRYHRPPLAQLSAKGLPTFTLYTDYYCMAYHLHLLLLNCSPFSCALPSTIVGKKSRTMPPQEVLAMKGNYCYSNLDDKTIIPEYCPDFNILTPKLQSLFIRAFEKGAKQPELRPSPDEFIPALLEYIEELSFCECDGWNHYIRNGYNSSFSCEWCRVEKIAGSFTDYPRELEDIQYMTDKELVTFSHKAKVKNNPDIMDYVVHELSCRYNNNGHIGKSELKAGIIKKLITGIGAKKAEKRHKNLK